MTTHDSRASTSGPGRATKVLIAVHGHEPGGWWLHASRTLTNWPHPMVLVLVVVDVPGPARTSLGSAAKLAYVATRSRWRQLEEEGTQETVEALRRALPAPVEVTHLVARRSDPGRTIAEVAAEWEADVVVVGPHRPGALPRLLLGAVHERVVRHARCAVLVTPPDGRVPGQRARVWSGPRAWLGRRRPVHANEGA